MLGALIGFLLGGFIGVCFGVLTSGNSYEKGVVDGIKEYEKRLKKEGERK